MHSMQFLSYTYEANWGNNLCFNVVKMDSLDFGASFDNVLSIGFPSLDCDLVQTTSLTAYFRFLATLLGWKPYYLELFCCQKCSNNHSHSISDFANRKIFYLFSRDFISFLPHIFSVIFNFPGYSPTWFIEVWFSDPQSWIFTTWWY